ncbi:MAG: hypothetical protein LBI68_10930, partial [Azoarcus sp.]|nr:hypothetical protein [Azoarcus sp.]
MTEIEEMLLTQAQAAYEQSVRGVLDSSKNIEIMQTNLKSLIKAGIEKKSIYVTYSNKFCGGVNIHMHIHEIFNDEPFMQKLIEANLDLSVSIFIYF